MIHKLWVYKLEIEIKVYILHIDGHESKPAISIFRIIYYIFINHKVIPLQLHVEFQNV